jgi:hypothetical protein
MNAHQDQEIRRPVTRSLTNNHSRAAARGVQPNPDLNPTRPRAPAPDYRGRAVTGRLALAVLWLAALARAYPRGSVAVACVLLAAAVTANGEVSHGSGTAAAATLDADPRNRPGTGQTYKERQ